MLKSNKAMLKLHLDPIFKARGIAKPYTFLVKAGLTSATAYMLLEGKSRSIKLDHVELLCRLLVCEPNDLMVWTPDKERNYAANHPLFKLRAQDEGSGWEETLGSLPFKELRELTKSIAAKKEEKS